MSNASLKHDTSIRVEAIRKSYRMQLALDGVSAEFNLGKIHLLIGPNGSGKSTFLRCVMGLTKYEGNVHYDKRLKFGYAPEEYIMPDSMTIRDFLACLGRIRRTVPQKSLDDYLTYFDLADRKHRLISSLSNGMKQKLNLIQAFLDDPNIILLDEPLRALDADAAAKCVELIRQKQRDVLFIISTHDPEKFRSRGVVVHRLEAGKFVEA
jgi:ABC-type multidrug transport system ATPase subunit